MTIKATANRELALDVLLEILEKGGYSHVVLRQALGKYQYLEKQDRAFVTRVVEGTIERLLTIDAVLGQCSSVNVKKMKPVIRTILRMSVYQILYMDRIPDSAVCNEAVKLAAGRRFSGLKGFVNGVLRAVARRRGEFSFADDLSLFYSMPQWLVDHFVGQYGQEKAKSVMGAFLEQQPFTVRCNRNRAKTEQIVASLQSQGVTVIPHPFAVHALLLSGYDYLERLEAFQKGWIQVQDASSMLVGEFASPSPGDFVVDVCGAPGGKAMHVADLLAGTGQVLVRDLTEAKIALIQEHISRNEVRNMRTQCWDAREFDPQLEEKADIVLADLPCSGLGIIGKKPDIKYRVTKEQLSELAALQREILRTVVRYVRPGGKLIYSTCTIDRAENEDQRSWILRELPFEPLALKPAAAPLMLAHPSLADGYVQLLPGQDPCDGFFIAAFQKRM